MTPTPATLQVTFNSNWAGIHRVCYRIQGSGDPYTCVDSADCAGGGAACVATAVISVDHQTCDEVTYEGYVQPTCYSLLSTDGRVTWTVTFTPDQPCDSYMLTCESVGVLSLSIDNVGTGYDPAPTDPPVIQFFPVDGNVTTPAAATAVVGDGGIKTWTITNGGVGYNAPSHANSIFTNVTALDIASTSTTDAVFNVTTVGGVVTALTLVSPGVGYTVLDTFKFLAADLGTNDDTECIIRVDTVNTGEIESVSVSDSGSGYTAPPIVSIDSPIGGGDQALLSVDEMNPCTPFTYEECSGSTSPSIEMELRQEAIFCDDGNLAAAIVGTGFAITADGCCYDCVDVDFLVGTEDADIYYRECGGDIVENLSVTKLTTLSATCVVRDSWYWTPQFEPGGDPDVTVTITEPTPGEDPCWWPT